MVPELFSRGIGIKQGDHKAGMADMTLFFDWADRVEGVLPFQEAYLFRAEVILELADSTSQVHRRGR